MRRKWRRGFRGPFSHRSATRRNLVGRSGVIVRVVTGDTLRGSVVHLPRRNWIKVLLGRWRHPASVAEVAFLGPVVVEHLRREEIVVVIRVTPDRPSVADHLARVALCLGVGPLARG